MDYQKLDSGSSDFDFQQISKDLQKYSKIIREYEHSSGHKRREKSEEITKLHEYLKAIFEKPRSNKDTKAKLSSLEKQFKQLNENFGKMRTNDEVELKASFDTEENLESIGVQERTSLAYRDSAQLRNEELTERKAQIEALNKDFVEVNEMFKDAAKMIHEDGKHLDVAEKHVIVAVAETGKGVQELHKADGYQKSARKKMMCIFLIAAVVVGVLLAIVLGVVVF
ncbi:hypothetical protein SteCoe_23836 [Stentor coeruleus]|uniref:t-SNARE coiled-coil homology domain-containing protein n=1 Tax=Stentor coeruleus TaxID=5963 RepID=A0A1R2BIW0_9CILI|nr:hypothetical protein SteCoe_23836 [Stentor coeruleus]